MTPADAPKPRTQSENLAQFQVNDNAAESYERWAPPILDLFELRPGESVLDVACGTGIVVRLAARRVAPGGAVTGVDLNEGMLADGTHDAVTCQLGLMFFPDRPKALSESRSACGPDPRRTSRRSAKPSRAT